MDTSVFEWLKNNLAEAIALYHAKLHGAPMPDGRPDMDWADLHAQIAARSEALLAYLDRQKALHPERLAVLP